MKKTNALYCALAASLALAGCASLQPGSASPCNQGVCKVTLTVTSCTDPVNGISATPDPVPVPRGTWHIQWDLATPGYEFTTNGISIPGNVPIPGTGKKVFEDPQRLNATKYQFKDNNESKASYKYKVELLKGRQTCSYDPTISND